MESVLGRYRNLVILVGVLFLQVLGLAVQVKRSDPESTRLIRIWAVEAITPLERGVVWVQNAAAEVWHSYFYLRGVRAENRQLKEQIEQMRLQQVRLNQDAEQAHRLQALLGFKEQFIAKTVAAQVIGSSGSDLSRAIYIDKGSDSGVAGDMPVITADGIVGKVLRVFPSTALVLLVNDQSSGVGAILERSRLQGVVKGTASGEIMLERVMSDEEVTVGEKVLSSGGDRIFPKGLQIGTVAKVSSNDRFLSIKVRSATNLSQLEEVLVVTEKQDRQPVTEEAARVRAADILAQRLPSVPEKAADAAGSAGKNTGATAGPGTKPQANGAAKPAAGAAKPTTTASTVKGQSPAAGAANPDTPKPPVAKTGPNDAEARDSMTAATDTKPANPEAKPAATKATPPATTPPDTPAQDIPH